MLPLGEMILQALLEERRELAGEEFTVEAAGQDQVRLWGRRKRLFAKRFARGNPHGEAEIRASHMLRDEPGLRTPRLEYVIERGEMMFAVWEWLEGHDLRETGREHLGEAFTLIGGFHSRHRNTQPVVSPTTRLSYPSIPELLHAEFDFLLSFCPPGCQPDPALAIRLLSAGYPTQIHGDLHPGNILLTPQGLAFTDWGYARNSLSLFDLDYVRSEALPSREDLGWWSIGTDEAEGVLSGYFASCGLERIDIRATHRAVMLWADLQAHYHCVRYRNPQAAQGRIRNIEWLASRITA